MAKARLQDELTSRLGHELCVSPLDRSILLGVIVKFSATSTTGNVVRSHIDAWSRPWASDRPNALVRLACGSMSTKCVRSPALAIKTPNAAAVVVLAVPPVWTSLDISVHHRRPPKGTMTLERSARHLRGVRDTTIVWSALAATPRLGKYFPQRASDAIVFRVGSMSCIKHPVP